MTRPDYSNVPQFNAVGRMPRVVSMDAVLLYDPEDGRVVHFHRSVAYEGVERRSPAEQERSAREQARRMGVDIDALRALHVPNYYAAGNAIAVDVRRRVLVEQPLPDRRSVVEREERQSSE